MGRPRVISDDDVLAAAREAFVEHGLGASTREIARRAGISEGVLFQRHGTKSELFFAAMEPPPFEWDRVFRGMSLQEDGRSRLGALAESLVRLAISYVTTPGDSAEETAKMVADLLGPFIDKALGGRMTEP